MQTNSAVKLDRPRATKGNAISLLGVSDALGFFESIALAGLEGSWIKLPVPTQRRFFGDNIFGSKSLRVTADGQVTVFWTSAFGRDWECAYLRYDQFQKSFIYENGQPWNRKNV